MLRSAVGFVLLLALLLGCLGVTRLMEDLHSPLSGTLQQAAELAEADFAGAAALAREAREDWKKAEPLSACFADHNPMEEINQEFAQLEVFTREEDKMAFAAACGSLAEKLEAMSDAHGLKWRNIF